MTPRGGRREGVGKPAPLCPICGERPCEKSTNGYRSKCYRCRRPLLKFNQHQRRRKKRLKENLKCERCEFVAEHPCQIELDHIDGDHSNNKQSNLQFLCGNCHNLKTEYDRQGLPMPEWRLR